MEEDQPSSSRSHKDLLSSSSSSSLPSPPARESAEHASGRRDAILEARRSRLIRRLSHHRAQRGHSSPCDTGVRKQRMLARFKEAQMRRERILQQQSKVCGDAVERAKRVARMQKAKQMEEREKQREDLERRLRQSELRRERLLSLPKSRILQSIHQNHDSNPDLLLAADEAFPNRRLNTLLSEFISYGLTLKSAEKSSFARLQRLLNSKELIRATSKLLQAIRQMMPLTSKRYSGNPAKVFLTAFMIVTHPHEVLGATGVDERLLVGITKTMLVKFEIWRDETAPSLKAQRLRSFNEAWHTYYRSFEAWKAKDAERLIRGLMAHHVELDRLWNTVANSPDFVTEWKPKIEEQQRDIRRHLAGLGGRQALERLEGARREVLEERPSSPEVEEDSIQIEAGPNHERGDYGNRPDKGSTPPASSPQAAPRSVEDAATPSTSKGASSVLSEIPIQSTGFSLTNEQLAHRIALDPNFELSPPPRSALEVYVRDVATQAFFDVAKEDFAQGRAERWVPVVGEIKQRLLEMVPASATSREIEEILDVDLMRQQAAKGVFDLQGCIRFILGIMHRLCAPSRDEAIQAIVRLEDPAEAFKQIFDMLDTMQLDLANFHIRMARPYIVQHIVEYERAGFEKALKEGTLSLERTEAWLRESAHGLKEEMAKRNPEGVPQPPLRYEQVYNTAMVAMMCTMESEGASSEASLPETMRLDVDRIVELRAEVRMVTKVAALLMLVRNFFGRNDPSLRDEIYRILRENIPTGRGGGDHGAEGGAESGDKSHGAEAITECILRWAGVQVSPERQSLLRAMVEKTLFKSGDTVVQLLLRRAQSTMAHHLASGQPMPLERLSSLGLEMVRADLERIGESVRELALFNRRVYAPWYDQILAQCINE
ncbi:uncharacterized protein VTP21DRAFT_8244 [Calcarisporiella thermophila]|uniref:uncharacterized protein n=1 Tax=Calcarisporiella thermophila TaxID=911321 RepID=UPI00374298F4